MVVLNHIGDMGMKKKAVLLFLSLLTFAFSTFGQDYMQEFGDGARVNWTKGEILVTGMGIIRGEKITTKNKLEAYRAARVDAMRRLVEVINGIQVNAQTKVKDYSQKNKTIRTRVEGMVRNFYETSVRYLEEGVCELDVMLPINGDGSISDLLLSDMTLPTVEDSLKVTPKVTPVSNDGITEKLALEAVTDTKGEQSVDESLVAKDENVEDTNQDANEEKSSEPSKTENEAPIVQLILKNISGLVIDASGKSVLPALSPKIISESGVEVYGYSKADRDFRKMSGLASYAADIGDAKLDKRVTQNPFVIVALGIKDGDPTTIVVSDQDAKSFEELKGSERILQRCRVIIVSSDQ